MNQIISTNELFEGNKSLFQDIEELIKSKNFPCLFALNSFHKNHMYFYDTRVISGSYYEEIYNNLLNFWAKFINPNGKTFYTIILILNPISKTSHDTIKNFVFSFLINLKRQDIASPNLTIDDILNSDFEFRLSNTTWFPVFLCSNHPTLLRNSPITLIAIQPKITFDNLKKQPNEFYEKVRQATHRRINNIYKNNKPFYLSDKSSGINAIQYIGFDPNHIETDH